MNFPKEVQDEIVATGLKAAQQIVEPDVGEATWTEAMQLLANAKKVDKPEWKEMLEKRSF